MEHRRLFRHARGLSQRDGRSQFPAGLLSDPGALRCEERGSPGRRALADLVSRRQSEPGRESARQRLRPRPPARLHAAAGAGGGCGAAPGATVTTCSQITDAALNVFGMLCITPDNPGYDVEFITI